MRTKTFSFKISNIIILLAFIVCNFLANGEILKANAGSLPKNAGSVNNVLCFGDSVTAGYPFEGTSSTYPANLQSLFNSAYGSGKYNVVNKGINGYRADQILNALQNDNWLGQYNPDLVLLMAGANDIAQETNPDGSNIVQVVNQTVSEMQSIVNKINSFTNSDGEVPKIVVSSFIPNRILGALGSVAISYYNSQLKSKLTGEDFYTEDNWYDFYDLGSGMARADLMSDNSHPNAAGYGVMSVNWFAAANYLISPSVPTPDPTPVPGKPGKNIEPKILVTSGHGEAVRMKVYDRHGNPFGSEIRNLFPSNYHGGAGIVAIDANNNGVKDQFLIFATNNGGPQARVFGIRSNNSLVFFGQMFVFGSSIRDGLSMAVGDFDDDGYEDDVAVALTGDRDPIVRVYKDARGVDNWEKIGEFKAPFGAVGANVGTFQYDNSASEILIAPHHGPADPKVYVYTVGGTKKAEFTAYGAGVTSGLTPSGIEDRIYVTPNNGSSHIMAFDRNGNRKNFWWAYQKYVRGDFKNVPGDVDRDGKDEILISPIGSNGSQILAFEPDGHWRTFPNFFAFGDKTLRNGVSFAVIENFHGEN